ncbi:hypothetical protein GCM10027276_34510 [Comamonas piscis]
MVFLAITPEGLQQALSAAEKTGQPVWCGSNAISEEAFSAMTGSGLSRFNYALDPQDVDSLADALDTIAQHHPASIVWLETVPVAEE